MKILRHDVFLSCEGLTVVPAYPHGGGSSCIWKKIPTYSIYHLSRLFRSPRVCATLSECSARLLKSLVTTRAVEEATETPLWLSIVLPSFHGSRRACDVCAGTVHGVARRSLSVR